MRTFVTLVVLLCVAIAASVTTAQETADGFALAVDRSGAIQLPDIDYRADWAVLGTWVVAGGEEVDGVAGAAGLHVVYTQPGVIEQYRKTGTFPNGAVLVKELLKAETGAMTTGVVSRATEIEGWFVMVKDTNNRFPDNKLWGDGWGWAFFGPDNPSVTTTQDYKAECLECHVPAKGTDWIYTKGYPPLRGAGVPK